MAKGHRNILLFGITIIALCALMVAVGAAAAKAATPPPHNIAMVTIDEYPLTYTPGDTLSFFYTLSNLKPTKQRYYLYLVLGDSPAPLKGGAYKRVVEIGPRAKKSMLFRIAPQGPVGQTGQFCLTISVGSGGTYACATAVKP